MTEKEGSARRKTDSHCHVNRLASRIHAKTRVLEKVESGEYRIEIVEAVANFCDRSICPKREAIKRWGSQGFRRTICLYPKSAVSSASYLKAVKDLLSEPNVVGLD